MGTQTFLALELRRNYDITEDQAWELVHKFEDLEIGDEISDALYGIRTGHPDEGIQDLYGLRKKLDEGIDALENALAHVDLRAVDDLD